MIGSSSFGLLTLCASRKHARPAISNASAEESTSWYLPSSSARLEVDHLVAGDLAALATRSRSLLDRRDVLARDAAADDLVGELDAGARRRAARRSSSLRRTGRSRRSASCACRCARRCVPNASRKLTCGRPMFASTPSSVRMRSIVTSRCSSPMPRSTRLAGFLVDLEPQRRVGLHHLVERGRHLVDVGARSSARPTR